MSSALRFAARRTTASARTIVPRVSRTSLRRGYASEHGGSHGGEGGSHTVWALGSAAVGIPGVYWALQPSADHGSSHANHHGNEDPHDEKSDAHAKKEEDKKQGADGDKKEDKSETEDKADSGDEEKKDEDSEQKDDKKDDKKADKEDDKKADKSDDSSSNGAKPVQKKAAGDSADNQSADGDVYQGKAADNEVPNKNEGAKTNVKGDSDGGKVVTGAKHSSDPHNNPNLGKKAEGVVATAKTPGPVKT